MQYDFFRPKPNVRRKCPFVTFGAETETETEIRSTSNQKVEVQGHGGIKYAGTAL